MDIDSLIEKWENRINSMSVGCMTINLHREFVDNLRQLKQQQKNNGDKLIAKIEELEQENKALKRKNETLLGKMDEPKQELNPKLDTDKIEDELVIERLCEIIAEK
jgi:FtsZ-binding cell division protein ZapB